MAKKKSEKVILSVLVDESGSMSGNQQSVIESYNEFIEDLRSSEEAKGKDVRATLGMFDTRSPLLRLKYNATPIEEVQPLILDDYQPAGGTPLNDAMLATITAVGKAKADRALVVVITDGLENSSEATAEAVAKEVRTREDEGWRFIYMGANQDSWEEGGRRGVAAQSSYKFASTPEGTRSAGAMMTNRGTAYLSDNATFDSTASSLYKETGNVIDEEQGPTRMSAKDIEAENKRIEAEEKTQRAEAKKRNAKTASDAATKVKDLLK
jgi:hypothetical protein